MYLSQDKTNTNTLSFCLSTTHKMENDESCDKKKDFSKNNSLVNKVESMKSNIFHSENKYKENLNTTVTNLNKKNKKETAENPISSVNIIKNKTNVSTVFDWTKTNTELVFKNRYSENNTKDNYTPSKMKMKNLISELDEPNSKNYQSKLNTASDDLEIQKKQIKEIMKEKYGSNNSRMQRNIESISNMHNYESYIKDLKSIILFIKLIRRIDKLKVIQSKILIILIV